MTERKFTVETGHWHDNHGEHGMSLRIQDALSGVTLVSLQLSAEQAYDFVRGSHQELPGDQSSNLDRVGKQMVNDSVTYERQDLGEAFWNDRDATLAKAVEMAKADLPGWESYEPRHTNRAGVTVVVRKWVAA